MTLKIEMLPYGAVGAAQAMVNRMRQYGAGRHDVLNDIRQSVFRGAYCWVAWEGPQGMGFAPAGIACAIFGKRRKGPFEPVMTWTDVFVMPERRRTGLAYRLYAEAEKEAERAGCVYMRAKAGSAAGLAFHRNLKQDCWGLEPTGEAFVCHPLPGKPQAPGKPPWAPLDHVLDAKAVDQLIREGLRYDR